MNYNLHQNQLDIISTVNQTISTLNAKLKAKYEQKLNLYHQAKEKYEEDNRNKEQKEEFTLKEPKLIQFNEYSQTIDSKTYYQIINKTLLENVIKTKELNNINYQDYSEVHSHLAQSVVQQVCDEYSYYFKALKEYFLTKDKNKPKANKERSSEEKARETKQIVDNLKKMQEHEKSWNEEQKNEVHYERNGLVRFESLTKQKPRKIKRGKSYQVFMENIDIYLDSNEVRLEIKKLLQDTKDYLLQGVFDVFDANRYLRGNIYFLVHKGSQLNDYERKILKSFKNKPYLKNIITIISICVIS